jgi:hypothetical protein
MARNLVTHLRRRQSSMAHYDRLPPELRQWLASAALPWSAHSALRLWQRSLRDTKGNLAATRAALARAEARMLARDAAKIWGAAHPATQVASTQGPPRQPRQPANAAAAPTNRR